MSTQNKNIQFSVEHEQVESLLPRGKFVISAHRKHTFILVLESRSRGKNFRRIAE